MKKYLLLLFVTFVSVAQAQDLTGYRSEFNLSHSIGVRAFTFDKISVHTIQGLQAGDSCFAGIGFGVDYYKNLTDNGELITPVYLHIGNYLQANKEYKPFISLDFGVGFGLTDNMKQKSGIMYKPSIGVISNGLKFQFGYNVQHKYVAPLNKVCNLECVEFLIGVTF